MTETGDRDAAELAVRLSVAITRLRSRLREEAGTTSSGFTISQLAILKRIVDEGPATAAVLAAAEHVSQQAIAQGIAPLKEAELVSAQRDPTDGRKMLISATAAGRDLVETMMASRTAWLVRAIDDVIGPQERAGLAVTIDLLERLAGSRAGREAGMRRTR